jgi:antitoxin (DNA-binding transcriptional repressor) of toxin-antitoxin stability system
MKAVTIKQAKARLNELVEAVENGEQVVLLRGSKHVAAIVAVTEDDLELAPRISDDQAARLWKQLADERASGRTVELESVAEAVAHLSLRRPG